MILYSTMQPTFISISVSKIPVPYFNLIPTSTNGAKVEAAADKNPYSSTSRRLISPV